ncbi:MAG TPA: PilN domain-containing protein [Candidatus Angelobacter sp.]|nr:PilN domain-containing protein [Candidatus Angelobacter sp.]
MIRINLLGTPKSRRSGSSGGRRPAPVSLPSEGPSTFVLALIIGVIAAVGMTVYYVILDRQHTALTQRLQTAMAENQRLSIVKAKYQESLKKKELFERRRNAIDQLKEAQQGPVDMLNLVADTVNKTDAVWLEGMTNDGKSVDFTGTALNPNAVADLMANLRKTGAFKTVEIKETAQDAQNKEIQTFKFELVCEIGKIQKKTT